jgi:hypothetical protein
LIPWDDDFDIVTEYRGIDWLKSYITKQTEWENLSFVRFVNLLKIFFKDGQPIPGANWKYPFVDLFFFRVNTTTSNYCVAPGVKECVKAKEIFPLKLRPLGKFWLPAPRNDEIYQFKNAFTDCFKSGLNFKSFLLTQALVRYQIFRKFFLIFYE